MARLFVAIGIMVVCVAAEGGGTPPTEDRLNGYTLQGPKFTSRAMGGDPSGLGVSRVSSYSFCNGLSSESVLVVRREEYNAADSSTSVVDPTACAKFTDAQGDMLLLLYTRSGSGTPWALSAIIEAGSDGVTVVGGGNERQTSATTYACDKDPYDQADSGGAVSVNGGEFRVSSSGGVTTVNVLQKPAPFTVKEMFGRGTCKALLGSALQTRSSP